MIDQMAGLVLTKLGGWPARVAGTDLVVRRRAEAVLRELRTEIAETCTKLADERGEPPLDEQDGRAPVRRRTMRRMSNAQALIFVAAVVVALAVMLLS